MEKYYYSYADKMDYIEGYSSEVYEQNKYVYNYTKNTYYAYEEGAPKGQEYEKYDEYYTSYTKEYQSLMDEYYVAKGKKDYAKVDYIYKKMNEMNKGFYEYSMSVYSYLEKYYMAGSYDKNTQLYQYIGYMKLYGQNQKRYYQQYSTKYGYNMKGYSYSVSMIKASDLKAYPYMERHYDEAEVSKLAENYSKYGITIPVVVSAKMGEDGKAYYHMIDGYNMYDAMMKNNEEYVPAIVYSNIPENVEKEYMSNPYYGYNYKN